VHWLKFHSFAARQVPNSVNYFEWVMKQYAMLYLEVSTLYIHATLGFCSWCTIVDSIWEYFQSFRRLRSSLGTTMRVEVCHKITRYTNFFMVDWSYLMKMVQWSSNIWGLIRPSLTVSCYVTHKHEFQRYQT
jgi:hypothetical protein